MYKCLDCGHIFEEGEESKWSESRGEFWGEPCTEEMSGCPLCDGDYEEAFTCEICGSEYTEDELFGGVCENCINDYRKGFDVCYKIASSEKKEIKINALLASLFCDSDIEDILVEHIKERMPDVDCSRYIDEDISWFGEQLLKEVKKDENAKG